MSEGGTVGKEPWKEQQTDCKRKTDNQIPQDYKNGNIRDTANTLNLEWRDIFFIWKNFHAPIAFSTLFPSIYVWMDNPHSVFN